MSEPVSATIPAEALQALVPLQQTIRQVLITASLGSDVDELAAQVAVAVAAGLAAQTEAAQSILAAQVRRQTAQQIVQAIEARRCGTDRKFCEACRCRPEDATLARQIGEADGLH